MNYYSGPIQSIYYLVDNNTIAESDYLRIANSLTFIYQTITVFPDQQQVEKLIYNLLDEERAFFLTSESFKLQIEGSLTEIIYSSSKGAMNTIIVKETVENWFATRLTQKQRIQFEFQNLYNFDEEEVNLKIRNDFNKVLSDENISYDEFVKMVIDSFGFFDGFEIVKRDGNMNLAFELPEIYSKLGRILKYNVDSFLVIWFNKHTKKKPTNLKKLTTSINKRLKFIKNETPKF